MVNKSPFSISQQIAKLKSKGMLFRDEVSANQLLANISYYRLKGYWWTFQSSTVANRLVPNVYFEDIIDFYNFDRQLRLILFDAIERIEVALRANMINILSLRYGGLWYLDPTLFSNTIIHRSDGTTVNIYINTIAELQKEFGRSSEVFIMDHKRRYPNGDSDAWKILEVASMGTLSKLYKELKPQMAEKAAVAKAMGLNLHNELSSWLESISYVRNIIAHHSRLWNRPMVKTPVYQLNNPQGLWLSQPLQNNQRNRPFLIISTMIYLCNKVAPGNTIKTELKDLFNSNANLPLDKIGFTHGWENNPLWE